MFLWKRRCQEERGGVRIDLSGTSGRGGLVEREAEGNLERHMQPLCVGISTEQLTRDGAWAASKQWIEAKTVLNHKKYALLCGAFCSSVRREVRSVLVRSPLRTGVYSELLKMRAVALFPITISLPGRIWDVQDVQLATDGTRKLVSVLTSGEGAGKKVETVIIPMLRYVTKRPIGLVYSEPRRFFALCRRDSSATPR